MEPHPSREVVLYAEDELQLWHARRPGYSIFGSYTGRVMLTSRRLLFLSTGGSGAGRRLLVGLALGPIGSLVWGQTPTDDLDASALEAEGSAAVPLDAITDHQAHKRCDCATYVGVQYAKDGGATTELAFMPKNSFLWEGAQKWAAEIAAAKSAFAASPYR